MEYIVLLAVATTVAADMHRSPDSAGTATDNPCPREKVRRDFAACLLAKRRLDISTDDCPDPITRANVRRLPLPRSDRYLCCLNCTLPVPTTRDCPPIGERMCGEIPPCNGRVPERNIIDGKPCCPTCRLFDRTCTKDKIRMKRMNAPTCTDSQVLVVDRAECDWKCRDKPMCDPACDDMHVCRPRLDDNGDPQPTCVKRRRVRLRFGLKRAALKELGKDATKEDVQEWIREAVGRLCDGEISRKECAGRIVSLAMEMRVTRMGRKDGMIEAEIDVPNDDGEPVPDEEPATEKREEAADPGQLIIDAVSSDEDFEQAQEIEKLSAETSGDTGTGTEDTSGDSSSMTGSDEGSPASVVTLASAGVALVAAATLF